MARLDELDIENDIEIYDKAGHGFMSEPPAWQKPASVLYTTTPFKWGADPDAAEDSWRRVLDFFDRHVNAN